MFPPKSPHPDGRTVKTSRFKEQSQFNSKKFGSNRQVFLKNINNKMFRRQQTGGSSKNLADSRDSILNRGGSRGSKNSRGKFKSAVGKLKMTLRFSPRNKHDTSYSRGKSRLGNTLPRDKSNKKRIRKSILQSNRSSSKNPRTPKEVFQRYVKKDSIEAFDEIEDINSHNRASLHDLTLNQSNPHQKEGFGPYMEQMNSQGKQAKQFSKLSSKTNLHDRSSSMLNQTGTNTHLASLKVLEKVPAKQPKDGLETFYKFFSIARKPIFERIRILYAPVYFKRDEFSAIRFNEIERLSIVSSDSENDEEQYEIRSTKSGAKKMQIAIENLKLGWEDERKEELDEIKIIEKSKKLK